MASGSTSVCSQEESPEYRAMRECCGMMVELLQYSIGRLGDALFARQLIPLDVKKNLRATTQSEENKTREAIEYTISQIKHNPQVFHDFVAVLKEQDLVDVADQLVSCYEAQTATPQPSTLPSSTSQSSPGQQYTLPSNVIQMMIESVRVVSLQEDQVCSLYCKFSYEPILKISYF